MNISICLEYTMPPDLMANLEKLKLRIEEYESRPRKTYTYYGQCKHKRKTSILSHKVVKQVEAIPDQIARVLLGHAISQPYREPISREWSCNTTDGSLTIKDIPLSIALADLKRAHIEGRLL